jgi:transaldolase
MVKLFADGANMNDMIEMANDSRIKGLTTNPSLMKKEGITDYRRFALSILSVIHDLPISFEVFTDDFREMVDQAITINSWARNVYVKIPITNTKGDSTFNVVKNLSLLGIKVNVTAITTINQVNNILPALNETMGAYISIFMGRISDTGIDPIPTMKSALELIINPKIELIWASPREVLNVVQANEIGCHIITCTSDIIKKLPLLGKDLTEYSRETVEMFYRDGQGFTI